MLAVIGSIVSIFNGLYLAFKNLFGGKTGVDQTQDAATQAVAMTNESGKESADIARHTTQATNESLAHVDEETAADLDRLRGADSLREQRAAVADAIARANQDPHSDDPVRGG